MKKNIALVTGGDSGESVISIQSAYIIKENIDKGKYNVYTIFIKGSKWTYLSDDNTEINVDKNDFSISENGGKIKFDAVFIAIHGTPGEDGKLQGYFDIMGIPYTFSGVVSSSLTFNKNYCQLLAKEYGAKTAKSVLIKKGGKFLVHDIIDITGLPCFVKPNNGGSSIGMSKVKKPEELQEAIETAFHEDTEVQIEEFIEGTEVTCGILQKKNELIALPLTEIVSKHEYFDFKSKYAPELAEEIIPARVPDEIHKKCKELSLSLFKKFNCKGVARFDYIIKNNIPYFLEVNTIPGLSAASIIPKQANAMGISLKELFSILIENIID
ncbi:MAG: D-alanine--D-alanine ligase [Bacteroidetes bacterium]|nr:D-alanine--D-alanine ligase [Bacteroidota bacterium]